MASHDLSSTKTRILGATPERFPELMGTHTKDFHLPLHSRSVFLRIGVVPAHQNYYKQQQKENHQKARVLFVFTETLLSRKSHTKKQRIWRVKLCCPAIFGHFRTLPCSFAGHFSAIFSSGLKDKKIAIANRCCFLSQTCPSPAGPQYLLPYSGLLATSGPTIRRGGVGE